MDGSGIGVIQEFSISVSLEIRMMDGVRLRSLFACNACKVARVKCDGNAAVACGRCSKSGSPCVYEPRKKRGPLPFIASDRETTTAPWVNNTAASLILIPRPLPRPGVLAGPEVPLLTSDDVVSFLPILGVINAMNTVINETTLFSALDVGGDRTSLTEWRPLDLQACGFTLLYLRGRLRHSKDTPVATDPFFSWAVECIDQSMNVGLPPSEHLVSALLLLSLCSRKFSDDPMKSVTFAALAQVVCGAIPAVSPAKLLAVASYACKARTHAASGIVTWPSRAAPIGMCLFGLML